MIGYFLVFRDYLLFSYVKENGGNVIYWQKSFINFCEQGNLLKLSYCKLEFIFKKKKKENTLKIKCWLPVSISWWGHLYLALTIRCFHKRRKPDFDVWPGLW